MGTSRVFTSVVLCLSLLVLSLTSTAAAADGTFSVDLPTQTNRLALTVNGVAPAGSVVESPQASYATTVDASSRFWITLTLTEGANTVTLTAKTPGNDILTWVGEVNVDLQAPALAVDLPRSINGRELVVFGQAAPGAQVTVNGDPVTPDATGRFRTDVVVHPPGGSIRVTATDDAGKTTEVRGYVVYRLDGSSHAFEGSQRLTFRAQAGSRVDLYQSATPDGDRTKVREIKLNADGTWSGAVSVALGWNYYWFRVTPPVGEPYYDFYPIFRAFDVIMVARTDQERLDIPGEVTPGWSISINGTKATVDESGKFVGVLTLKLGEQRVSITARRDDDPIFSTTQYFQVTRVPPLAPVYQPVLTLQNQSLLDVFVVGKSAYRADRTGNVRIPLPLKQGSNLIVLPVIRGSDRPQVHVYRVDYIPSTVVRLTLDQATAEVDGVLTPMPVAPSVREGSAYLPLRFLAEVLGAKVEWDQATKTATYWRGNRLIQVTVDAKFGTVNGETVELSAPAVLENDRTLVPVRFISEHLGATVSWDEATRTITVIMPKD